MKHSQRDHGGGVDAAIAQFGGTRSDWIDLSTGINPVPYPIPEMPSAVWQELPDKAAKQRLIDTARSFWDVPNDADILPSSGVSQLIALMPHLSAGQDVRIESPTYNEHAASFENFGHAINAAGHSRVVVHPNNPDGRLFSRDELTNPNGLSVIDESFCDTIPDASHIKLASNKNTIVLKGLGKFWGLAGLRLGFAIGSARNIQRLRDLIGPWAVSGPALQIGTQALADAAWATSTRARLQSDSDALDRLMTRANAELVGGTSLFRLYSVDDPTKLQTQLARKYIWSRTFPYSKNWVRLGLPGTQSDWKRLSDALGLKP